MNPAMKYARMVGGEVQEVFTPPDGVSIEACFHADVAAQFVECPDNVTPGSTLDGAGNWTIAPAPEIVPPTVRRSPLTPMQFYLAFTPQERMAIKASVDALVAEFWATYELAVQLGAEIDPYLPSVIEGVQYLRAQNILAADERIDQILAGEPR